MARNLVGRTAIALDCETNTKTGELPPTFEAAVERVRAAGLAGVIYTSHHHSDTAPRFRVVMPLTQELDFLLPAPEVVARGLGLWGVLDTSKVGAASLFYLPSCEPGQGEHHRIAEVDGAPVDAAGLPRKPARYWRSVGPRRQRWRLMPTPRPSYSGSCERVALRPSDQTE